MRVIYSKFNYERLPRFQIVTKIVKSDNKDLFAVKSPLDQKAIGHIDTIYKNYVRLKKHRGICYVMAEKSGNDVVFPMARGRSIEELLIQAIRQNDIDQIRVNLKRYFTIINKITCYQRPNKSTKDSFKSVFGDMLGRQEFFKEWIEPANIDLTFNNIILDGNHHKIIDYEWIFNFRIPKSYIIWRAFHHFSVRHSIDLESFSSERLFTQEEKEIFADLENHFLYYVFGPNSQTLLLNSIKKKTVTLDELTKKPATKQGHKEFTHGQKVAENGTLPKKRYDESVSKDNCLSLSVDSSFHKFKDQYRDWLSNRKNHDEIFIYESRYWDVSPFFSIFLNYDQEEPEKLADFLESLSKQAYSEFNLTIISPFKCIDPIFDELPNLKWTNPKENFWKTINHYASFSREDTWLIFLRAGDLLESHTLTSLASTVNYYKHAKLIYFDHEERSNSTTFTPVFKPDFNLDLLRSYDYIGRAFTISSEIFNTISGFDPRHKLAECYDLALRTADTVSSSEINHVQDILLSIESITLNDDEKKLKSVASKLSIQNHLNRRNLEAVVVDGNLQDTFRCIYHYEEQPLVSIIIPTKNQASLLKQCVSSIIEKTLYKNYEIIITDNGSNEESAIEYLQSLETGHPDKVTIISYDKVFNYSDANNIAAHKARGEFLLLLNNDTEIIQENWLDILVSYCQRTKVGAVGPRLLFPNGTIQHAGIIVGLEGMAEHPFLGAQIDEPGYMNRLQVDQNYSAVTAACMLVKRKAFEDVKGFDQKHYQLNFSDVDFCLKLGKAGYKIIWTPHVTLIHHTSITQKKEAEDPEKAKKAKEQFEKDKQALVDLWFPVLCNDPAYNYNLSLGSRQFDIDITENPGWPAAIYNLPRIWAFPRAKDGAGEYRVRRPLAALLDQGLALTHFAELMLVPNALLRHRPSTIIFQTPTADEALDYLKQIRKYHDGLLIYEIDDLLHHIPFKNPAFQNLRGQNLKKKIKEGVNYCDRMIVSTRPLADAYEGFCKDIRIVPNYISKAVWGELKSKKRNGSKPRVGWAGGAFHYGDLMVIKDVVKDLANEVDWIFMGMCPDEIKPYVAEYHEGVDIDKYPSKLASLDLDLAVAPLEINAFNKAKSNLRLLEYGILAWPVIATDILPYQDAPVTLVKNKYRDWLRTIKAKIADPLALEREGEKLQKWVIENWILEDHLEEILLAYV